MKKCSLLYFAASRPAYEKIGQVPSVIFYGTDRLREDPAFVFSTRWKRNPVLQLFCKPLENYLIGRTGIGFRLDQVLRHLFALCHQDVILGETDSTGLPVLLLKRLGLIRGRVGFISAGLINVLEAQQDTWLFTWYRWLLKAADFIVCWSPVEERLFRDLMGAQAHFVTLEADTDFYVPKQSVLTDDFILCVGRDGGRDFRTLFHVLEILKIPARVVTSAQRVKGLHVPENVQLVLDPVDYPVLLDWYRRARLVVVSLQEIHRFTGQRALLESLAMGKATVVARTQAVKGTYSLKDGEAVAFYEPGNQDDLAARIRDLYQDGDKRKQLEMHARQFVERLPKDAFYLELRKLILNVCAEL